jgi:rhodanese-related sulfurtransferase
MRPDANNQTGRPSRRTAIWALAAAGVAGAAVLGARALARTDKERPENVIDADSAHQGATTGDIVLVDIRTPEEWLETGIGEGAIALDMRAQDFVTSLVSLRQANPEKPIALICRTGNRSSYVIAELTRQGFPGLVDVSEGMAGGRNGPGWLTRGLPIYAGQPDQIAARRDAVLDR